MKLINIKNIADFLPNYTENKIVLFENNPTVHSEKFELKTNAKLWYHFAVDQNFSKEYLREKGAVKTSEGAQAIRNLQWMLTHPELWTNIDSIFVAPFGMGSLGLIQDPLNENEIIVLMPFKFIHPMADFTDRGSGGYVWQSLPIDAIDDPHLFSTYCTECFGIFEHKLKLDFYSILINYLVSPQYSKLLNS